MRPQWRLAINSLWQRPSRTLLLMLVVALSAALICAVSSAMAAFNTSLKRRVLMTVGAADLTVQPLAKGQPLAANWEGVISRWPEVERAVGRREAALNLRAVRPVWEAEDGAAGEFVRRVETYQAYAQGLSYDQARDGAVRPMDLAAGRWPAAPDEIVIDATLLDRLRGIAGRQGRRSTVLSALTRLRGAASTADESRALLGPVKASSAEVARELTERYRVALGGEVEILRGGGNAGGGGSFLGTALAGMAGREAERASEGQSAAGPGEGAIGRSVRVKIVGLLPPTLLGGRSQVYMLPDALGDVGGMGGTWSSFDVVLKPGGDADATARRYAERFGGQVLVRTTAKITSDAVRNIESNQIGLVVASVMAFLSAAFIIMTGMTTGVAERQRELAVLRCIGASRGQIGGSQLIYGLVVGVAGAAVGVPVGVGLATFVLWYFQSEFKVDLGFPALGMAVAFVGSVAAGLVGAAWPAWRAARLSPLKALAVRAEVPRAAGVARVIGVGAALVLTHLVIVTVTSDSRALFWLYAALALPAMFIGYFLLSVGATLLVVRGLGGLIARLMGLPGRLLERTVRATPYRHGFTAGALMAGLAMMVAIWTQGGAFMRDWIGKIQFPDAFATGFALAPGAEDQARRLPFVRGVSAISLYPVETESFGIKDLQSFKTMFIGFNPDDFMAQMDLDWVQGDRATAFAKLRQGGAIIVAREFLTAQGLGVGDTFHARANGQEAQFEIVGVVTSPGLEMVSGFFDVGDDYVNQAMHAVFGTRSDLSRLFLNGTPPPTQMLQFRLDPEIKDEDALAQTREALMDYGVLDVGSGRRFREMIVGFIERSLYITSAIAMMSMIVACLGVANLIVAGIDARKFEFGVLRAIGAGRGMICRLVLAEAVIIALAAGLMGTLMGIQGAYGGTRLNAVLMGIELGLRPPVGPIAAGWGIVMVLALGAAAPAVLALARRKPRELLAAVKG